MDIQRPFLVSIAETDVLDRLLPIYGMNITMRMCCQSLPRTSNCPGRPGTRLAASTSRLISAALAIRAARASNLFGPLALVHVPRLLIALWTAFISVMLNLPGDISLFAVRSSATEHESTLGNSGK